MIARKRPNAANWKKTRTLPDVCIVMHQDTRNQLATSVQTWNIVLPSGQLLKHRKNSLRIRKIPKTHKLKSTQSTNFSINGFKLIQSRLTKPEEKDDWQHAAPRSLKMDTFTQHTDLQSNDIQHNESADDFFELYKNSRERYIIKSPYKMKQKTQSSL